MTLSKIQAESINLADTYTFTGTLTAAAFSGDGSGLTNVPAGVSSVKTVIFSSSGTYTPTSGTKFMQVWCTGGGGGAGHLYQDNSSNSRDMSGGGAGAGGTAFRTYTAAQMGSTASISIGAGGSGASSSGSSGNTGGTTTFTPSGGGTTLYGYGGNGALGVTSNNNTFTGSGDGGSASGGEININGQDGEITGSSSWTYSNKLPASQGGSGGHSFWGMGGKRVVRLNSNGSTNGNNGTYGGGGSGGVMLVANFQTSVTGGSGGSGVVVIMEYA